jgi:hypothetical protein
MKTQRQGTSVLVHCHRNNEDYDDDGGGDDNNNNISKAIYEDCRRRNKNLGIAWIDYQKAFDSVPRSWVEKSRALVGENRKIVRF